VKLFSCQHCGTLLHFENVRCERCGHRVGFLSEALHLHALVPAGEDSWTALDAAGRWRDCANAADSVCNWMVPEDSGHAFCAACRHNVTIPDLADAERRALWAVLEAAKHRLIYSLLALRLPLRDRREDPEHGLGFRFLADAPDGPRVLTGHDRGLITVSLNEADDALRAAMQARMGERYRTPLGHLRHEVGHHYWDLLVRDGGRLAPFRALFGDERQDYAEALRAHYARPAGEGWNDRFVSAYASAHPWEDFAETWAHLLHILDTVETAAAFGLAIAPEAGHEAGARFEPGFAARADTAELVRAWLPLSLAMNALGRSMGQKDPYPFVLSPAVVEKLGFVHALVREAAA
jgi:hypothetical protein